MAVEESSLAEAILAAHARGELLRAPTDHGLDSAGAYRTQERVTAGRLASGGRIAGWKLGYTSAVMREQMGVAEPNFGPLLDRMLLRNGAGVPADVVHPRVEPEVAAVFGADVRPGDPVLAGVASWRAALEIVDSVWEDYQFDWALNTADGSSAAYVVLGPDLPEQQLGNMEVVLEVSGSDSQRGTDSAAMGDPRRALAWLAMQLAERDIGFQAGDVVITGGLTRALALPRAGTAIARFGEAVVHTQRA